jgi:hypothetical protein
MVNPVESITRVHAPTAVPASTARQNAPASNAHELAADTVEISNAARVLQQRTEASSQTVKAADSGDLQAKARLATPARA